MSQLKTPFHANFANKSELIPCGFQLAKRPIGGSGNARF